MSLKKMLNTKDAAEILGVSPAFLERDRWRGASISFVRIGQGNGAVRYKLETLEKYIESRTVKVKGE